MYSNEFPRYDQLEPAFKRYEPYIARCYNNGSFELNPRDEWLRQGRRSTSVHSWAIRCRDAILAFQRFNYHSNSIPKGADLRHIKVIERPPIVLMHNTLMSTYDTIMTTSSTQAPVLSLAGASVSDSWDKITAFVEHLSTRYDSRMEQAKLDPKLRVPEYEPETLPVTFNNQEERLRLVTLISEHDHCVWVPLKSTKPNLVVLTEL